MKKLLATFLLFGTTLLLAAAPVDANYNTVDPPMTRTLRLHISNVKEATGMVWVGIYQSEADFLDKSKARLVGIKIYATGQAYVDLPDMEIGKEYALAIFHDVDNDGDMNRNWLGLPSEPWAFTGEVRTRLRLPTFDEVKFLMTAEKSTASLILRMI